MFRLFACVRAQWCTHTCDLHVTFDWAYEQVVRLKTYLLSAALVRSLVLVVDAAEVGDDDGDGQSDHQHAAQGADGAEDLSSDGFWHHVPVTTGETDEKRRVGFTRSVNIHLFFNK